jgi:hypothetical protein
MPTTVATATLARPSSDSYDSPMSQEERAFMAHLKHFNADKGKSLNVRKLKKKGFIIFATCRLGNACRGGLKLALCFLICSEFRFSIDCRSICSLSFTPSWHVAAFRM